MRRAFGAGALFLLALGGTVTAGRSGWADPRPSPRLSSLPVSTRAAASASSCPVPAKGPQFYAPGIPSGGKTVALTFDDGPGPSTMKILSILKSFGVRATFFNIGESETEWPGDVRAESRDGYLVGNHTWDHPDMTNLPASAQAPEMDRVVREQQSLTGTSPCVFRPPYGDYDSTTLSLASERHMATWLWSVDTEDWKADGSGSLYWVNRIISLAESEGGALRHPVVLMHNQAIPMPATVAALPTVIRFFQSHGYAFVDLLGRTGPPGSCGRAPAGAHIPSATDLRAGSRLAPRSSLSSPGGQFRLVMQRDGNLVLYSAGGQALWASGTRGFAGAWAEMQPEGGFVIYSSSDQVVWSTGTGHHPGAWFALENNANLVVYDSRSAIWSSGSADSRLLGSERLEPGWYLESPNHLCRLVMQRDGNLVLYSAAGDPLWASGTRGVRGAWAVMQRDGNFVVYSKAGRAAWSSGTLGHEHLHLSLTDSARAFVASASGAVLWATG